MKTASATMTNYDALWDKVYEDPELIKRCLKQYEHIENLALSSKKDSERMRTVIMDINLAIDSLEERERQCINMHCIMGMPEHQVATSLGIYQPTVGKIVKRSLIKMLRFLNEHK